jgi:hypothetical protein
MGAADGAGDGLVRRLQKAPPMKAQAEGIPGSGLPTVAFISVLATSVGVFLFWSGALWRAPREASHVTRFLVSYLIVVPLASGLLLALRRFTWAHLVTTTGAVWAMKLVITSIFFQAFARGTATDLHAVAPPASAIDGTAARPGPDYHAATSAFAGAIRGHVRRGGKPVAGAVVFLDAPLPGRAAPPAERVDMVISASRYAEPIYLAHLDDEVRLVNRDGVLHTARFSGAGTLPPTRPTPPGAAPRAVVFAEPGIFRVRCDNHPGEGTWIVVVDHPYATRTAADGSFSMEGAPEGSARVIAVDASEAAARRVSASAVVPLRGSVVFDLDTDAGLSI